MTQSPLWEGPRECGPGAAVAWEWACPEAPPPRAKTGPGWRCGCAAPPATPPALLGIYPPGAASPRGPQSPLRSSRWELPDLALADVPAPPFTFPNFIIPSWRWPATPWCLCRPQPFPCNACIHPLLLPSQGSWHTCFDGHVPPTGAGVSTLNSISSSFPPGFREPWPETPLGYSSYP